MVRPCAYQASELIEDSFKHFVLDFWNWFLENTKYFSLVAIFYFSITNATLVNTVYVLLVLLFTAFPGITGTQLICNV